MKPNLHHLTKNSPTKLNNALSENPPRPNKGVITQQLLVIHALLGTTQNIFLVVVKGTLFHSYSYNLRMDNENTVKNHMES